MLIESGIVILSRLNERKCVRNYVGSRISGDDSTRNNGLGTTVHFAVQKFGKSLVSFSFFKLSYFIITLLSVRNSLLYICCEGVILGGDDAILNTAIVTKK